MAGIHTVPILEALSLVGCRPGTRDHGCLRPGPPKVCWEYIRSSRDVTQWDLENQ